MTWKVARTNVIDLGSKNILTQMLLFSMAFILLVMPIGAILIAALIKLQGERSLTSFGFQNLHTIFFKTDETYRAVWTSVFWPCFRIYLQSFEVRPFSSRRNDFKNYQ